MVYRQARQMGTEQRGTIGLLPVEDIAIQQVAGCYRHNPGVVGCYDSWSL